MLFDSHAHVNFKQFAKDRSETIQRALDNDVWMINIGSQLSTSQRAVEIAHEYNEGVYAAIGLHPIHLENQVYEDMVDGEKIEFRTRAEDFDIDEYKKLGQDKKVVGIGEVGFDYYHIQSKDKQQVLEMQKKSLLQHLELAKKLNKPVILHCRDAYDEMLNFLQGRGESINGVLHCYGGNPEQAKGYIELGLYIGFTGIVTFKNAKSVQETAKNIPLDRILVETDCPYLAPEPFRGKRNEPLYVRHIAEKIAELKQLQFEEVSTQTFQNTKKLFNI